MSTPPRTSLPGRAERIFIWHQGALGDVLVAGPALLALSRHYPPAHFTLVGGVEQLSLLGTTLPVAAIWSSQRAVWLPLFQPDGPVEPTLAAMLAPFDLAVVFSPQESPAFHRRLQLHGVPHVVWLPSFPHQERRAVGLLHQERLQALGLPVATGPLRLTLPPAKVEAARQALAAQSRAHNLWVALAPGSGHPLKNWPLAHYLELADYLAQHQRADVWWLLGPAEAHLREQIWSSVGHDPSQHLLVDLPLIQVAASLGHMHLYVGNDSGLTHLAAAVGVPRVAALFGPSDPIVWQPPGAVVLTSAKPCAPCSRNRTISCPEPVCLMDLTPAQVCRGLAPLLDRTEQVKTESPPCSLQMTTIQQDSHHPADDHTQTHETDEQVDGTLKIVSGPQADYSHEDKKPE